MLIRTESFVAFACTVAGKAEVAIASEATSEVAFVKIYEAAYAAATEAASASACTAAFAATSIIDSATTSKVTFATTSAFAPGVAAATVSDIAPEAASGEGRVCNSAAAPWDASIVCHKSGGWSASQLRCLDAGPLEIAYLRAAPYTATLAVAYLRAAPLQAGSLDGTPLNAACLKAPARETVH